MEDVSLSGIIRAADGSAAVAGYRIAASLTRRLQIGPKRDGAIDLPASGSGLADADGAFSFTVPGDGTAKGPVVLTVSMPDGVQVYTQELTLDDALRPLDLRVPPLRPLTISPSENPARGERVALSGRVIDTRGMPVPSGIPVVLWGVLADDGATPQPLVVTQTQAGGYFSGAWTSVTLAEAFGRVAGSAPIPIRTEDQRLPRQVLLVLEVPETDSATDGQPPRLPEPEDLVRNPAAFSQDLGRGCIDLCTPNRVIEEFTYSMVVRTSEPDVHGLTLGARKIVPPQLLAQLVQASVMHEAMLRGAVSNEDVTALKDLTLDVGTARTLAAGDQPPTIVDVKRAAWLSEVSHVKDLAAVAISGSLARRPLDASDPIDWDDTPTVYQAISIARGHILDFREVWRADGYSLGDLLYSLPLAPGQRRQVAIVDWERRSTTTREEALEYEEALDAFVSRDRDVSEIVGSRLAEESAGASHNTTWGAAGGIGAGFIGSGFGIFGGVAGSAGGSESGAWQNSSRRFSADTLQSLRDRVMQRASSVRDQRSTVVQTAAQGETLRAETETVANYNHCHAMTVEYFEVLRHFAITHELADVRECLFVPLPMTEFTAGKALRWQTPLTAYLRERSLLPGFDAMRRIADNWEGWDYPLSRYSEEAPQFLEGELRISFVLPRPRDASDGAFQIDMWDAYRPLLWMDPYELWTQYLQQGIAEFNAREIAKRDRAFRDKIAPELAARAIDRLRFWYVTTAGSEVEVHLDASLVSRYAEGTPLYVTLRPSGELPPIPREQIAQFKITLDAATLPADAQIIVHTGKVRYRTEHKQWLLFSDQRILNDLSNSDAVYISTPTSWAETRNPRQEDRDLQQRLLAHLNEAIEYYHQVIWSWLDDARRFMLLDGILVPALGGKSVASVVENRLIGIAGNSLILPLAPGIRIDPRVSGNSKGDLIDLYAADSPPPLRISVPTRGVYAEAILDGCEACEEIDDSRYWRWTTAGMLTPPAIEQVSTDSRAEGETALTPTPLPTPLVSIQNAPDLPAPPGLSDVFKLLAKPDLFTDITGLEGTQKNARAAFDAALSAASGVFDTAAKLAKQNMASRDGERMLDRIDRARNDGLLAPGTAQDLSTQVFSAMAGAADEKSRKKADSPVADPQVQKALHKAAQADTATVKVTTLDETLEVSFDGGDVAIGGAAGSPQLLELQQWMQQPVIIDTAAPTATGEFTIVSKQIDKLADLKAAYPAAVANIESKFLRPQAADSSRYELFGRLRIVYPGDPKQPKTVAGKGRLPLAVLVHGQHASWQFGEVRNLDGYSYLQEHLARQGIVSVAVDTNAANYFDSLVEMRARIVLHAIDALRKLDGDKTSRFHKRLDFDRVALMGHSRGGDAVAAAALLNAGNKHCVIRAVAMVAPTDFTGRIAVAQRHSLSAAEAGFAFVLYGGLDGDVSGRGGTNGLVGTGFRHYDRAGAPAAMVYVPGCIHNRFNRTWSVDEFGLLPADLPRVHSRADHEQLMIEYVGGLFEWKLAGITARAALFHGMATNTLGHPASLQWNWGRYQKVIEDFENPASGTLGNRTVHGAEVKAFGDVKVGSTALALHTSHQTGILAIDDNLPGPVELALEIDLPPGKRDWSGYTLLTFRLGTWMDISTQATINDGTSPPPLAIMLIDGAGKSGSVDHTAFTTPDLPGKPVFHQVKSGSTGDTLNCTLHRLATVAITLTGFKVNLKDVRKLQVVPPAGFAQRIFLDSLQLVTP